MNKLPSISCRIETYRRPKFVGEVIGYFLRQDYGGKKELVILNDDPSMHLVYKHPEVRIFNWPYRFSNLRNKINEATRCCKYEIIFPWADDDVYERWALSVVAKNLGDMPFVVLYPFWKHSSDSCRLINSVQRGMYIIRKKLWDEIGGYPEDAKTDADIQKMVKLLGLYTEVKLKDNEVYYTWRSNITRKHYGHNFEPVGEGPEFKPDSGRKPEIVQLQVNI